VLLAAAQHPDGGRTREALTLCVPSAPSQQPVPRGGERRHVRHLRAAGERERRLGGQAEQLLQPTPRDLLDDRFGRAARVGGRVLIPRRGQPVRGQRGRHSPADHPPEEAPARAPEDPAGGIGHELVDHALGRQPGLWQRATERGAELRQPGGRRHRPAVETVEEVGGMIGGASQQRTGRCHTSSKRHEARQTTVHHPGP
jgi:hypothetical protein